MTRLAVALLLAAGVSAFAEDKPIGQPIIEVKLDPADKPGVKPGKWTEPSKVRSAEELEKLIADKDTRAKIAKAVDLKTHDLLVFAWEGSGGDKLEYAVLESYPEQIPFSLKLGMTDDVRTHVKVFGLRKNVRWSAK